MGRRPHVKKGMAVMHNASGNVFYVNYTTPLRVCIGNMFMTFDVTMGQFNKKYSILGMV